MLQDPTNLLDPLNPLSPFSPINPASPIYGDGTRVSIPDRPLTPAERRTDNITAGLFIALLVVYLIAVIRHSRQVRRELNTRD